MDSPDLPSAPNNRPVRRYNSESPSVLGFTLYLVTAEYTPSMASSVQLKGRLEQTTSPRGNNPTDAVYRKSFADENSTDEFQRSLLVPTLLTDRRIELLVFSPSRLLTVQPDRTHRLSYNDAMGNQVSSPSTDAGYGRDQDASSSASELPISFPNTSDDKDNGGRRSPGFCPYNGA